MAARIFTCHHVVPEQLFRPNRLFTTLVSGVYSDPRGLYLGDLDGENIASENVYSELRHQYYVWRNLLGRYDYVGFEHYRRVFFLDPAPAARARVAPLLWQWRRYLQSSRATAYINTDADAIAAYLLYRSHFTAADCRALEAWLSHYDIIVQRPSVLDGLEQQWKSCLAPEYWDQMFLAVHETLTASGGCDIGSGVQTGYFNNMYIMRSELFDQYMTFLMQCADKILRRIPPFQRMIGHCAERIFSFWLYQRRLEAPLLRVHELPYLYDMASVLPNLPGNYGQPGTPA